MLTNYLVIAAAALTSFFLEMGVDVNNVAMTLDPWLDSLRVWIRYSGYFA